MPVFLRLISLLTAFLAVILLPALAQAEPLVADGFRIAGDAARTRVVLDLDGKPPVKWFLLRGPHRMVVDLPDTRFALDPDDLDARGLVDGIRYGQLDEGKSRLILSSKGPFSVEAAEVVANENGEGFRLVAELVAAPEAEFEAALARQASSAAEAVTTAKGDRLGIVSHRPDKRFTIVIDPGHGGIDGGAEGRNGTVEKAITLVFANGLKDHLAATGLYDVHLTRDDDTFLRLDERVRIARQHGADLLISIHADTIRLKGIRGATVYTLSDKASDAEAEALAARENLSDELAGISVADADHQIADILVDLIRRETHGFSMRFARTLLGELSGAVELINNPHRAAGFRVLQAPDVPSVLLELGYLSNEKDEAQLSDAVWRERATKSIAAAIARFAEAKMAAGG